MTTSGTYSFTVTAADIITDALQELQVIGEGDSPSAYDIQRCTFALNLMLKRWAAKAVPLWTIKTISFPVVANTGTYTIGPTGTVASSFRPLQIMEGWSRDVNGIDTPLNPISRVDYDNLGNKNSTASVPVNFYFNPTIGSGVSASNSTVTFYPVPTDATRTIYFNVQRPLQDITTITDEFDFPAEWFEAIKWNLAASVAFKYRANENIVAYIQRLAKSSLEECMEYSQETTSVVFQPNFEQGGGYGSR